MRLTFIKIQNNKNTIKQIGAFTRIFLTIRRGNLHGNIFSLRVCPPTVRFYRNGRKSLRLF
ncbi:hypothetical protein LEP1GSC060_3751 [Leptospira weilii serovar Ranarum str. ICFT]|uniref:Uncharacterized protein n=1 Tax=Leptospira weilii serovar Ranarum str. ICFT TaxID=1218598 RepID=N1WI53_9LEPT|nr:hypothetical protein LEP1GSC060_3751 [Leptospira weilii serovar Ranarum str. ICFT]